MKTDKIIINNMKIYAYHGVFEEEKKMGQNFYIDLEIYKSLKLAGTTDDLNYSTDYSKIYKLTEDIAKKNKFNLIETLAEKIADKIMEASHVNAVMVRVKKPAAPIEGNFDYVGVEIFREKNEKQ